MNFKNIQSIENVQSLLEKHNYIADRSLATSIYLSLVMDKPIFLEGEPGVGKTEVGKVLAQILGTDLIRLQCYEGLDVHNAIYEWNYSRQILQIRMMEAEGQT
ncbi:MAG: MoxR family ATPase, partial [Candidatus Neomarinimicrobiota bacterium]|nr:MoxR family ATPase [Candidatus Neomarinimicrobiota bacterium]